MKPAGFHFPALANFLSESRRIKTEFLLQFDGIGSDDDRILLVGGIPFSATGLCFDSSAATNRPQELDDAALRRMKKRLYIPLPDHNARISIIRSLLQNHQHCLTDEVSSMASCGLLKL